MKKLLLISFVVLAGIITLRAQATISGGQSIVLASVAAPYTVGDIISADTTTTFQLINDIATGNVLLSGGVGTIPSWGKVALTTHVSGTLPVANGGTGLVAATYGSTAPASSTGFGSGVAGVIQAGSMDYAGRVTIGTGGDTTGAVTLGGTYSVAPHCVANNEVSAAAVNVSATTTVLTMTGTFLASDKVTWVCR